MTVIEIQVCRITEGSNPQLWSALTNSCKAEKSTLIGYSKKLTLLSRDLLLPRRIALTKMIRRLQSLTVLDLIWLMPVKVSAPKCGTDTLNYNTNNTIRKTSKIFALAHKCPTTPSSENFHRGLPQLTELFKGD